MDLSDRCRLLLDRIADRIPPDVLAEARSYGADGEWAAALITVINTDIVFSPEEEDLVNELLDELADPPPDEGPLERRREFLAHPSHSQYYVGDWDREYYPAVAPLEEDTLISVHADRHMIKVTTGMYGFDLPLTVEILDAEPAADLAAWQEVSEASVVLTGPVLFIASVEMDQVDRFPLPAGPDQAPLLPRPRPRHGSRRGEKSRPCLRRRRRTAPRVSPHPGLARPFRAAQDLEALRISSLMIGPAHLGGQLARDRPADGARSRRVEQRSRFVKRSAGCGRRLQGRPGWSAGPRPRRHWPSF